MADRYWYEDAVFYHIYTFSLAQAPFQNDYAVQGRAFPDIEKWLPHIKKLGCNAVLFSPVLKSRTHGYDVTDYFVIDNRVGTNDEFKSLVGAFHKNGVRVVLDSVFNHCGRDFFAFQELRNGNREYASWFSGVDFNRQSPMGDPFHYDTWSGYYELPKFNLQNNAVRQYLSDAAKFWINEFDIDGMRLDSANVIDFGFMRELRGVTASLKRDFWLMGEVVGGEYQRWVDDNTLHSVTNYILYKSLFSSHNDNNLYELAHSLQNAKPSNGLPLYNFLDNHDQPRIASNIKNGAFLEMLYTVMFTLPGLPSIYYGSEWGIRGVKENGSDQPLRPYIDIMNPPEDAPALPAHIARLAGIRQRHDALKYGGYRQVYLEYHRPFVFERFAGNERIFVAVNVGESQDTFNLSGQHSGNFTDLLTDESIIASSANSIPVAPYSVRVLLAV
ncbi:MAG: alpha-amylase family glycosyl hydrolase [Chitinispirillia bacterium]|nr:alpha-amylase family glycosyl hydrolase [Chitinispirillia bacterium]